MFCCENGYRTYVSDTLTAKLGADLSSHQGSIDWDSLTQSPIDFVILRPDTEAILTAPSTLIRPLQKTLQRPETPDWA